MWKVVIADDEPLIVSGLSEKVNWKQMDCTVVGVASNGLQARTHLEKLNPDILLTDVAMPGMTGLELAAWLRQQKRRTRVILLSAYDYFQYAQEGIRMGACDYILKPINMERLREAVSKAIHRNGKARNWIFCLMRCNMARWRENGWPDLSGASYYA